MRDGPVRVLHVEDDPDFADLAADLLERAWDGFSVETAGSVDEGIDRLEGAAFDCVVSDYDLPDADGLDFLEAVREDDPDLPFVLFTGKGSEAVASEAISAGVTDYLRKETDTDQFAILANRLRTIVEGYRARQAGADAERQLRQAYERVTDGFFGVDADWRYTYVNEAATRIVDRPADDLLGTVVWEAFPGLGGSPFEEALRTAMESQETTSVEAYYPPHEARYDVRVYPAPDGISIYFRDVTDRHQRDRELELKDQLVQEMNDGAVVAQDGVVEYVNPRVAELVGHDADELVGESMLDFVAPEDRETVAERHRARLDDGAASPPEVYEIELLTAAGDRRPVEISVSAIEYEGAPATLSLVRDVADRRAREHELRRLKEEYETVFETAQDAVFLVDVDRTDGEDLEFRIKRLNPAHEAISGLASAEVRGQTPSDFLAESDAAEVVANYRRCVEAAEPIAYDEVLEMPTGDIHWRTKLGPVVTDGEVTQIVGVARDVTVERARRRELERYRRLVETVGDPMYMLDPDGRIEMVNRTMLRKLGADESRVVGASIGEFMADGDFERGTEVIRDLLADPDRDWATFEMTARTPAGDDVPAETNLAVVEEDGEYLGSVGVVRDISERTAREAELQRQNERLEEFASVVSHDLRNPLGVAKGRLELAAEEVESEHLEPAAAALDRMDDLIERLLQLAREGREVGDLEPVALAAAADRCWTTVETAGATLDVAADGTVLADGSRLGQLLENLFRNAVEYGGDGVEVVVGDLDGGFYVADDGPGLPEDDPAAAFEPGYSTSASGTGFGLSIVRDIADAHGWAIDVVESEAGGARFEFTGVLRK